MDLSKTIGVEVKSLSNLIMNGMDKTITDGVLSSMTGIHGWIISFVYNHEDLPVFQRDVEKHFKLSRSTVTELLQLMEKNGLITRESVDYDARLKQIKLTPHSIDLQEKLHQQILLFEERICAGLSKAELDAFYTTIEKMKQNIK